MNQKTPPAPERLVFTDRRATVPARTATPPSQTRGTFASALRAEPRDWGYAGLFLFTAVLLLRPQDTIPALRPLHLAEVCVFAGILPMLLHRLARQYPTFRVNHETLGMIALGVVMLATVPTSIWPGGALAEFTDAYLKIFIVFILMMNTVTTSRRLDRLMWLIIVCLGIVAVRGVADYLRGLNLVEGDRLAGPVGGILGNPNDLALNMVTFLPTAIVFALSTRRPGWQRLLATLIALCMLATVVFTKSRSGALGLGAAFVVLLLLGHQVRRGFAAIAVASILMATPFVPASFWNRMSSIMNARQDAREFTGSRDARETVMKEGLQTFEEHPFAGVGAGQFKNYNPPGREERWRETHNALLQVASELGALGLVAFLFLIVCAGLASRRTRQLVARIRTLARARGRAVLPARDAARLDEHSVAMTAGLAGWFVCAMFASVAYNWTFYYLLALTVAARELAAYYLRDADAGEVAEGKATAHSAARFSTQRTLRPA